METTNENLHFDNGFKRLMIVTGEMLVSCKRGKWDHA